MKVWIDISNAPHVRFFKDVIKYLEAEGEDVIVTARQFGDIHKLLEMYEIDFISVGKHGVSLYDKLRESMVKGLMSPLASIPLNFLESHSV